MHGYRSRAVDAKYTLARKSGAAVWKDIESQIKYEVFNLPRKIDSSGLWFVPQPIKGSFVLLFIERQKIRSKGLVLGPSAQKNLSVIYFSLRLTKLKIFFVKINTSIQIKTLNKNCNAVFTFLKRFVVKAQTASIYINRILCKISQNFKKKTSTLFVF